MYRSHPEANRRYLPGTGILLLLFVGIGTNAASAQTAPPAHSSAPPAPSDDIVAYLLDVRVNGWASGIVGRFRQQGSRLAIRADQFESIGFRSNPALVTKIGDVSWIALDRLPGVSWKIDAHTQSIEITASPSLLKESDYKLGSRGYRVPSHSDWGAMLSYDIYGQWSPGSDGLYAPGLSANLDTKIFSPHFTASSNGLLTVSGGQTRYVRLDSTIIFDSPDNSQSLRLGDSYTAGPSWVRTIRFGGVQWARNFSLRPDIVTSPVAKLSQDVAVPSTVDLFVNGIRSYSQAVSPGTIRLDDLPVATGSNTVDMVITDQSGRRTEVSLPFYSSSQLLAAGMTDFDVEAGFPRLSYTSQSNDYGRLFASGTISRGINDHLTLRGYVAATRGYEGGALGATMRIGSLGVFDGAVLASNANSGMGLGYYLGVEHVTHSFSLSGSYTHADSHYQDLATTFDATAFTDQATASLGFHAGKVGNFNLAYVWSHKAGVTASGIASATWRAQVGHRHGIDLSISGYADTIDKGWGGVLSLSFQFGRNTRVYAQQSWRDNQQIGSLQANGNSQDQRLTWQAEASQGGHG